MHARTRHSPPRVTSRDRGHGEKTTHAMEGFFGPLMNFFDARVRPFPTILMGIACVLPLLREDEEAHPDEDEAETEGAAEAAEAISDARVHRVLMGIVCVLPLLPWFVFVLLLFRRGRRFVMHQIRRWCPLVSDGKTRCAVAAGSDLKRLKRARNSGCPWDESACEAAADSGHLDCLQYLHQNGCPWNEKTCEAAMRHGYLDCLTYAHENGCPWGEETYTEAAFYEYFVSNLLERRPHLQGWRQGVRECLEYARANGAPCDFNKIQDTTSGTAAEKMGALLSHSHVPGFSSISDSDRETILRELSEIQAILDENSQQLPEGAYIDAARRLQEIYKTQSRISMA